MKKAESFEKENEDEEDEEEEDEDNKLIVKNGKECYQSFLTSEGNAKKEDFWAESNSSGYDNWNYERDTYYALGGSDYDRWKEDGGDLDSMMDGMGR